MTRGVNGNVRETGKRAIDLFFPSRYRYRLQGSRGF
jgi:hypothetical protein